MFASPSFDASPPHPGGRGGGLRPSQDDDDEDDERQTSPIIFSSGDEEDVDDEDDDEEDVDIDEEEEEEEDHDDDDEDDDDDDDDDVNPDAATPASTTTTRTTTTGTGQMPPPPANPTATATTTATNSNLVGAGNTHLTIRAVPEIKLGPQYREIGKEALCWQLSSAKPGNGVEQIRDGSTDTYWQSDGLKQPHWIQVHFARRVAVSHVCLYLDYSLDESYTPKRVSVHHGMTSQDLQSAVYPAHTEIEFVEPNGWCIIPLNAPPDPLDVYHENAATAAAQQSHCVRAHLLRISILAMHQNGRDTHIRQVELYGPRRPNLPPALRPASSNPAAQNVHDENDDPMMMVMDEDFSLPRWSSTGGVTSSSSPASALIWGGGVIR